jgi:hypothetical protein
MKKTTTPKQLNLCKFLNAAFAFCLQVGDLVAQITADFTRAGLSQQQTAGSMSDLNQRGV